MFEFLNSTVWITNIVKCDWIVVGVLLQKKKKKKI